MSNDITSLFNPKNHEFEARGSQFLINNMSVEVQF